LLRFWSVGAGISVGTKLPANFLGR
jgi:hypothetical protein